MAGRPTLQKCSALKFAYCIIQLQADAAAGVSILPSHHNVQGCKNFFKSELKSRRHVFIIQKLRKHSVLK